MLLSLQSVQLPNTAVYEIHVCKRGCHCGDSDQGRALQRIHGMVFREKYPGRGSMAVSLGCMYALSNFLIGYYSNVMWLDCIMLLPVLAYLIEQLVHTGNGEGIVWCWGTVF